MIRATLLGGRPQRGRLKLWGNMHLCHGRRSWENDKQVEQLVAGPLATPREAHHREHGVPWLAAGSSLLSYSNARGGPTAL